MAMRFVLQLPLCHNSRLLFLSRKFKAERYLEGDDGTVTGVDGGGKSGSTPRER